ncbi:Gfo/Idh/MocA family protein [Pseudonocardia acidicola]|uniref:Gfo/Idh/MocA family oxidoreductase n=1 Tax=Pseudonocardia acidicola TaxID=2724939 RepID=A0ABX1SEL3_9PSEU|nr:Gfo/Idh/MocA family oxidoreductase [Pseudonocardia acidicola]NMH98791.1 Gfo/Idh/MocA family oxidoreductase [Pseudonocardia acidicola]
MADQLRAGIVGAGFIGAVHAHAVRAAGGVVARVAASTPERSAEAAARVGASAPAATAEDLIDADDVDVVHICTPNSLHVPLARRALAAGKPVICEKPLATGLDDARALADLAGGRVATVPFVYRFYPAVREARARVAAGQAGPLHLLHGAYLQDWQAGGASAGWRGEAGEGGAYRAFADVGVHWCDLVEFTTGHRITRLSARTSGGGTVSTVAFETDAGATGSTVISQTSIGRRNALRFSLDGAEAAYGFDQEHPETLLVGGIAENRTVHRGSPATSGAAGRYSLLPPGHPQGYQDCFNAFVADTYAAIGGSAPDGLPTFADGARAAALVDAVITSSESSTWVEVPS